MVSWKLLSIPIGAVLVGLTSAPPALAQNDSCTGPAGAVRMFVNVQGVRSSNGLVAVTVYGDDRGRFLQKRGSLYVGRVPAVAGRTRVCLNLPRTGVYALAVYHDVDGDRKFDKNAIGLPAEAYGFSNNPRTLLGLPSFSSVRINVPRTNLEATVRLTYP